MTTINDIMKSKKNYAFYKRSDYGKDFPRLYSGIFTLDYCTAGIPVGVTTTFWGPPSSGKCLKYDTLIFTNKGIVELGSFKEGRKLGFSPLVESVAGPVGVSVNTSDYYIDKTQETIYVKNSLGVEVEGTLSHKIKVLNKKAEFKMKSLSDIKEGDVACICRNNSVFSTENQKLPEYSREFKSCSNDINLPEKITTEFARLFGYLIANGFNVGKTGLGISTQNKKIKKDIDDICKKFNLVVGKTYQGGTFKVGGVKFRDVISSCLCGDKFPTARFKKIPNIILQSTKEIQINFLQALFDCDSYLQNNGKGYLSYCSASEILAKQVQIVLLGLGIISVRKYRYLKEYDHDYWHVNLTNNSTYDFLEMCNSLKYSDYNSERTKCSNIDLIPHLKEFLVDKITKLREIFNVNGAGCFYYNGKYLRFNCGYVTHTHLDRNVTYKYLDNLICDLKKLPSIKEVTTLLDICIKFKELNYFYSPVVEIKHKKEKTYVYDFNIPDGHLYLSNGYVSHNSSSLLRLLGLAQKTCWNCFEFLWDCECGNTLKKKSILVSNEGFDLERAQQLGCDINELIVAEPATGEECVDIVYECLNADDCGLLLLDSFSRVIPEAEIFNPALDNHMGKRAQLHTKLMNKVKSTLLLNKRKKVNTCFVAINQARAKIGGSYGPTEEMSGCYASKHDWHLSCRLGALAPKPDMIDQQTDLPIYSRHSLSLVSPGIKRKVFTLAGKGEFLMALENTMEYNIGDSCDHKTTIDYAIRLELLDKKKWKLFDVEYGTRTKIIEKWQADPQYYLTTKRRIIEYAANIKRGIIEKAEEKATKEE